MEESNLPLEGGPLKLNTEAPGGGPQGAEEDFAGWPEVKARFLKTQQSHLSSTLRDAGSRAGSAAGQASPA